MKHKDINQFSADGASSAIGSIAEYEALSCTTRPNDVQLSVCSANQNWNNLGDTLLGQSHLLNLQTRNWVGMPYLDIRHQQGPGG